MLIKLRYLFLTFLFGFYHAAFAVTPAVLYSMQLKPSKNATQITFLLSKKTSGTVKFFSNPERVVLEFANTKTNFTMNNARIGGANVLSMKQEKDSNNTLRFVFFVSAKVNWTTNFLPNTGKKGVIFQLNILSDSKSSQVIKKSRQTLIVVIDPGHGGRDSGACGINGVAEKNVVLNIAKELAKKINQQPNMRAVLTRKGDYFVPLYQRLRFARKGDADLFISIHADAYFNSNAKGASVYVLSRGGASTMMARWLAVRENHTELGDIKLDNLQDRSPMLRSVLLDLAQTKTAEDSLQFGNRVLDGLDNVTRLHYKRVESAPFLVLKSPDIPSVLIETGFISNPYDEKNLANAIYQERMADAISGGVRRWALSS